jgi:hypothetical protein
MAFSQQDVDRLKRMLATGTLRSRIADRDTTFRSFDEIRETIAMAEEEIAAGTTKKPKQYRPRTSKGLI